MKELVNTDYLLKTPAEFVVYIAPDEKHVLSFRAKELLNSIGGYEANFLLRGSGFNMENQIQRWIDGYNRGIKNNEPFEIIKDRLIEETISDLAGFYFEYFSDHDIFPFDLEIKNDTNGKKVVFATKYNETLKNITNIEEREGALLEGIEKAVEMIANSGPNTVVFLTSPDGWSGLGHPHPDTQTYVYWIDKNGDLKAMTLRTHISLEENENLVEVNSSTENTTRERIKEIVRSPFQMKVVDDGFLEVLDRIEEKTGVSFPKLRKEITYRNIYNSLTSKENEEIGKLLNNLRQFMKDDVNYLDECSIKNLALKIGKCILDMKYEVNKRKMKFEKIINVSGYDSSELKYEMLYDQVRKLKGCNGGGEFERSFGYDRYGSLEFSCPSCRKKNIRPFGQLIPNCQICGADVSC